LDVFFKVFSPTGAQFDSLKINFKFALKLTLQRKKPFDLV